MIFNLFILLTVLIVLIGLVFDVCTFLTLKIDSWFKSKNNLRG